MLPLLRGCYEISLCACALAHKHAHKEGNLVPRSKCIITRIPGNRVLTLVTAALLISHVGTGVTNVSIVPGIPIRVTRCVRLEHVVRA